MWILEEWMSLLRGCGLASRMSGEHVRSVRPKKRHVQELGCHSSQSFPVTNQSSLHHSVVCMTDTPSAYQSSSLFTVRQMPYCRSKRESCSYYRTGHQEVRPKKSTDAVRSARTPRTSCRLASEMKKTRTPKVETAAEVL